MTSTVQMNQSQHRFTRRSGFATVDGVLYEVKVVMFLFMKGINSGKPFKVAANMDAGGKFDDVIFQCQVGNETKTYLIQLKYMKKGSLGVKRLISTSGDFSLFKYLESYRSIIENYPTNDDLQNLGELDSFRFVIYTNCSIPQQNQYKVNVNSMLNSGGEVISFKDKAHDEIFTAFKDYRLFSIFLDDVQKYLNVNDVQKIDHMLQDIKRKVKTKDVMTKLNEHNFQDPSIVNKLKNNIVDTSLFEEFFKNLTFHSSQANVKKFDNEIKREIETAYNTSQSITDSMLTELENHVTQWRERTGNFLCLTESSPFWQKIIEKRISEIKLLSNTIIDELNGLNIRFEESEVTLLKQQIEVTQALKVTTQGSLTDLSNLKVFQAVQDECFIFVRLTALMNGAINIFSSWKTNWSKYLIIEDTETSADVTDVTNTITQILKSDVTKKLILIGPRNSSLSSHLSGLLSNFSDKYNLTSLTPDSQDLLLDKLIYFQGYKVPLNSLVDKDKELRKIVSNDFLCKLSNLKEEDIKVGDDIKKGIDYYIQRTLHRHILFNLLEINKMISDEDMKIAISGSTEAHNCIVFDPEQRSFEEISENYDDIHWFHRETSGKFVWKESKGNIKNVFKYLKNKEWRFYEPKTLLDFEDKVILVVGQPGMGKSTLVTQLAVQTMERVSKGPVLQQSTWIVRINLHDHTQVLSKTSKNDLNIDFIINFLEVEVLKLCSDVEKQLFEHSLKNKGNVVIICDAFDEISPEYAEKVSIIMKKIQTVNKGKLWVTTRYKDREKLEKDLSTFAFSLQPFRESDQCKFLQNVWKYKFSTIDEDVLKNFVQNLLQLTIKSLSDGERKFTGIPLTTMMLAEVFEDNAREYSETPHKQNLLPAIDLLELYIKFVDKKLHILWTEKSRLDMSLTTVQTFYEDYKERFLKHHKNCALISLFPPEILSRIEGFKKPIKFLTDVENGKEKSGIIVGMKDGKPQFIHQTFAEYFSAVWFSENYKHNESFLSEHIFRSSYDVLKNIFDRVLAKDKKLHKAVLNNDRNTVKQLLQVGVDINDLDEGGRNALHLAVSLAKCSQSEEDSFNYSTFLYAHTENMTNEDLMVKLLLENNVDINRRDEVLGWTPLQYADKSGTSFTILGLLLEHNANPSELADTKEKLQKFEEAFIERTFVTAIEHGFQKLITYMIKNGISANLELPRDKCRVTKENSTIFHKSVLSGKFNIASKLAKMGANADIPDSNGNTALHLASRDDKREAVEFLINIKCNIEPRNNTGDTPLHLAARNGDTNIVKCLVENGANTALLNNAKHSALHLAACQDNLELVIYLYKNGGKRFFEESRRAVTPLHLAAKKGKLNNVKYLVQQGINVDICDEKGNTPLHYTSSFHYASRNPNSDIIECLTEAGANLNKQDERGNTVIFWAFESGGSDLFEYLVKKGIDLNIKNNTDDTLFMHAIRSEKTEEVTYLLQSNKIDISVCNESGNNALHLAAQKGNIELASQLLDRNKTLNKPNKDGNTPILHAAHHGKWDVVKMLTRKGSNLYAKNICNHETVLHMASEQGNLNIVKWLLEKRCNINDETKIGDSMLHYAAKSRNIVLLQYISKLGVNFNLRNNLGDSVLHMAARTNGDKIVEFLIGKGVQVNGKNTAGLTPLHESVSQGPECVNILIKNGANVSAKDKQGRTSLHIASINRDINFDIIQTLIFNGADVNALDKSHRTALHLVLEARSEIKAKHSLTEEKEKNLVRVVTLLAGSNAVQGHLDAAILHASLTGFWNVVPCLVEKGANVNVSDTNGFTPLHIAAYKGELDVVNYLLDKNANIDVVTQKYKITPLHFAAFSGDCKTVIMLLQQCYRMIYKKDFLGNTALHCAALSRNSTLVLYLIKMRAGVRSVNKMNKTALQLAVKNQRKSNEKSNSVIDCLKAIQLCLYR